MSKSSGSKRPQRDPTVQPSFCLAKYGLKAEQFLEGALKGDLSDNIPGVPGVGEKIGH